MRLSTLPTIGFVILLFARSFVCGTIFTVGSGNHKQLNENFDLCMMLIGGMIVMAGLAIYQFSREQKSRRMKNKMIIDKINDVYDNTGNKVSISNADISERKRLPPKKETIRQLLKYSGNRCNFYSCTNVLVDYQGYLQGHIVSIMSNEKNQPNYNSRLSNEERIKNDNLILLCHDHFFDLKLHQKYDIDTLLTKKHDAEESPRREQSFDFDDRIIDELIQDYLDRYI